MTIVIPDIQLPDGVEIIPTIPSPPILTIGGSRTQIFPFELPESRQLQLFMEATPLRPDHTLRVWVSTKPLDNIVIPNGAIRDMFFIPKRQVRVWFGDEANPAPAKLFDFFWRTFTLEPDKTYFFNVLNQENSTGTFEFLFNDATKPLPGEITTETDVVVNDPELPPGLIQNIVVEGEDHEHAHREQDGDGDDRVY